MIRNEFLPCQLLHPSFSLVNMQYSDMDNVGDIFEKKEKLCKAKNLDL